MKRRSKITGQWPVRLLCALALLLIGFGHQTVTAGQSVWPADFAAYSLPDGSLPSLCVTLVDENGKSHGKVAHLRACEACRISACAVLPAPDATAVDHVVFISRIELPPSAATVVRQMYPPNVGPRAPPFDSLPV